MMGVIHKPGNNTERLTYNLFETPDPGEYQDKFIEFKINQIGGKFQKDTRKDLCEGIDTPGPGTYKTEVKETVNNMMRSTSKRNFDDF